MKKNKTIAYMLAATLLVGGTFLGTKALFTDSDIATNDLVITMGNLNVDVDEGEWEIENEGTEAQNLTNNDRFVNVKPGDSFLKKITVTNNGSLKQKLSVSHASGEYPDEILVGNTIYAELNGEILNPGESKDVYINVKIKEEMGGKFGEGFNQDVKPTFNFNDIFTPFTITAEQLSASEK